jgi:hypothetical protein
MRVLRASSMFRPMQQMDAANWYKPANKILYWKCPKNQQKFAAALVHVDPRDTLAHHLFSALNKFLAIKMGC